MKCEKWDDLGRLQVIQAQRQSTRIWPNFTKFEHNTSLAKRWKF